MQACIHEHNERGSGRRRTQSHGPCVNCLCQGDVIDDLHYHASRSASIQHNDTLQKDLLDFDSINALPDAVSLKRLSGISKTLASSKKAKYHKSCRTMLNRQMFLRAEKSKRTLQHDDVALSPKKTLDPTGNCQLY